MGSANYCHTKQAIILKGLDNYAKDDNGHIIIQGWGQKIKGRLFFFKYGTDGDRHSVPGGSLLYELYTAVGMCHSKECILVFELFWSEIGIV